MRWYKDYQILWHKHKVTILTPNHPHRKRIVMYVRDQKNLTERKKTFYLLAFLDSALEELADIRDKEDRSFLKRLLRKNEPQTTPELSTPEQRKKHYFTKRVRPNPKG